MPIPSLPSKLQKELDDSKITIKDLLKPEIYETLSLHTKYFLKYKPLEKIPRASIAKFDKFVSKKLAPIKPLITGSYIRGNATSGDIDLVVRDDWTWDEIMQVLAKYKPLPPYMIGDDRLSTYIQLDSKKYVQLDVFKVPQESYIFMVLYTVGNKKFNIRMRALASKRGYLLNQKGLYKDGVPIKVKNEEEIFKILNMRYKKYTDRNE